MSGVENAAPRHDGTWSSNPFAPAASPSLPVTRARLVEIGVLTIGQLAKTPGWSLERLLGPGAGGKLAALASR